MKAGGRRTDPDRPAATADGSELTTVAAERRRASRSLWDACEALLTAANPRSLQRALESLRNAFDCAGVSIHARGASGRLEPWCARGDWRARPGDLRACLTAPLVRDGERVGTLDLRAHPGVSWRPAQLALIRTAAGALGAALGARLELDRLRHQPGRDAVTGLPDARGFHARFAEELSRARRHGVPLSVLAVDLDRFAALNARYGRKVGDAVLAEAALVIRLAVRDSDIVARLGGDDFALLLPETDRLPALRCAERVRRAIESHRFARVGRMSASAGVAASPVDGVEPLELLDHAERVLGIAKKSGRRRAVASPRSPVL